MGNFQDFLIALEAEDITGEVEDETSKAVGKQSITSNPSNRNIMETDDILGTKSKNSVKSAAPAADTSNNNDDESSDDVTSSDDTIEDDNDNNDDLSFNDDEPENNTDSLEEDPSDENNSEQESNELRNKIRLRENMILFYNILSTNINLLSDFIPNNNIPEYNDLLYKVQKNLSECKTILYKLITEEIQIDEYATVLRKYIALNQVYDLCIRILSKHFNNLSLVDPSQKSKKIKEKEKLKNSAKNEG